MTIYAIVRRIGGDVVRFEVGNSGHEPCDHTTYDRRPWRGMPDVEKATDAAVRALLDHIATDPTFHYTWAPKLRREMKRRQRQWSEILGGAL